MPSSSSYAARIPRKKNVSAGSKKRRFAGKLRKLRWLIYQKMKHKKKLAQNGDYLDTNNDIFKNCAVRTPRKNDLSANSKKRRLAGKLRKLRWIIYQKMKFKKKRLNWIFNYYKKQVDLFLIQFSSNLKPFEVVIWKQKVMTTWKVVSKYLCDEKKATTIAVDMPVRTKPDVCGSTKLDSVLCMLSTILHLVRETRPGKSCKLSSK